MNITVTIGKVSITLTVPPEVIQQLLRGLTIKSG